MSQYSILQRLHLSGLAVTTVIWLITSVSILIAIDIILIDEQEEQLFELIDYVEDEFGEIVDSVEEFNQQPFDYDLFAQKLYIPEHLGLVFWHKEKMMMHKLPLGVEPTNIDLLKVRPKPIDGVFKIDLGVFPDTESVSAIMVYPEFEITLQVMSVQSDNADNFLIFSALLVILLIVSLIVSSILYGKMNKASVNSIVMLADQFNSAADKQTNIDINTLPQELKRVGSEFNRLLAEHTLQQTEKTNALEKEKLFTVNAAHELLTPLTVLKSEVQLATAEHKDEKFAVSLKGINHRIDRVTNTIEQLVNLARLGSESIGDSPVHTVDLNLIFEDELALLGHTIEQKNLNIVDCDLSNGSLPLLLKGNTSHISILFRNLIENAIKYALPEGKLSYSFQANEQNVIFRIENQCEPIPTFLKQQLFEVFSRRPGENQSGSGLGLAIVKQICLLNNYQIKILDSSQFEGVAVEVVFK